MEKKTVPRAGKGTQRPDMRTAEFCFFDGKRKRCRGFVTLTASVYHPLIRKQITVAVMESESKNTENVTLFWKLFNVLLAKVSKDVTRKFDPIGWCTDMAGANMAGIFKVFGEEVKSRIKLCEFHFKEHRNKMATKLASESSEVFRSLCNRLLESQTPDAYHKGKTQMDQFITCAVERSFLKSWLAWWHDRRGFIFRALAPRQGPQINQAEVVHAWWVHCDLPNFSLLDACQADVRDAVKLDVELKAYEQGTAAGGTGPSYIQRQWKKHSEQVKKRQSNLVKMCFVQARGESGTKSTPNQNIVLITMQPQRGKKVAHYHLTSYLRKGSHQKFTVRIKCIQLHSVICQVNPRVLQTLY